MKRPFLLAALLLAGCENRDRLSDEQAMREAAPSGQDLPIGEADSAAASSATVPSDPGETIYKALGTEPGWALTVRQNAMLYQGDYGAVRIVEATPPDFRPAPGRNRSGRLSITIAPGPCSDGMSDHVWRDRVTVQVAGGATSRGCGGGMVEVNAIEGTDWVVTAVNGRPTGGGQAYSLSFADGEVRGAFGCNSLSGQFSRNGDHLTVSSLVGTEMACGAPADAFEREGAAVLTSNARIEQVGGRTRLVSEAGSIDLEPRRQEGPTA